MKGLILKDFYNLRSSFKQTVFFNILFITFGVVFKNPIFIFTLIAMLGFNFPLACFTYDEKVDFYSYGLSLPLSRRQIVLARYLTTFILLVSSVGIISLVNIFLIVPRMDIILLDSMASIFSITATIVVLLNIMIPLSFKSGVEATRKFLPIIVVSIAAIVFLFKEPILKFLGNKDIEAFFLTGFKLAPIVLIILSLISIKLSIKFMENKDF